MDIALLLLRVVVGVILAAHGAQKLFGWFGGFGIAGTGGWLESMGFRPGRLQAAMVGLSEFGGGLLLAFGFLTPLAAAAAIGVMLVAIASVHFEKGFFNTSGGYEFNLLIIASVLALSIAGPGAYSLDNAFGWNLDGIGAGVASLTLAALGAGIVLLARRLEAAAPAKLAQDEERARAA